MTRYRTIVADFMFPRRLRRERKEAWEAVAFMQSCVNRRCQPPTVSTATPLLDINAEWRALEVAGDG